MMLGKDFAQWMAAVNREIIRLCGMTADDLPDWDYARAYERGVKPETAAKRAIAAASKF